MAKAKAVDGVTTGMSPYTPLELQEMGVAAEAAGGAPETPPEGPALLGSGWGGISGTTNLAPQCTVPNVTSWEVRRYHTRHQNYRRYHYHHAPAS
jgi:hypothetical protein